MGASLSTRAARDLPAPRPSTRRLRLAARCGEDVSAIAEQARRLADRGRLAAVDVECSLAYDDAAVSALVDAAGLHKLVFRF